MNVLEIASQMGIAFFGLLAIVLVARKNKWGFVLGLISVPFWFITSIVNRQWGIVLLNIAYTVSWVYGIWCWFFRKKHFLLWEIWPEKRKNPSSFIGV